MAYCKPGRMHSPGRDSRYLQSTLLTREIRSPEYDHIRTRAAVDLSYIHADTKTAGANPE